MQTKKGLTVKDQKYINSYCNSIAKCERYGTREQELIQQIYMLGLYTFRQYHHAGFPLDIKHPGLNQQSYTPQTNKYEHNSASARLGNILVDNPTNAVLV